jgi:hypothetical protein
MKQEEKDIHELLRGHFESFEAEPDRDLWVEIQAGMQAEAASRRKVLPLWSRYAAVAASLLLIGGVIWQLSTTTPPPDPALAQRAKPQSEEPSPQSSDHLQANEAATPSAPTPEAPSPRAEAASTPVQRAVVKRVAPTPEAEKPEPLTAEAPRRDPRMANIGVGVTTPVHQQWTSQQLEQPLAATHEAVAIESRRSPRRTEQDAEAKATRGYNNRLDINNLTLANAVSFASEELSKWAESPVEIYTERTPERQVRTYEFDLLDLKITRKVYRQKKN